MSLTIKPLAPEKRGACPEKFGFGSDFSDHMFIQHHDVAKGWYDATIEPYHDLVLDPSAAVLHYSQEIFEGLKAYRRKDGGVNLFRPMENMKRFNRSARRMVMPEVDPEFHLEVLMKMLELDQAWVPNEHGASLYIRPAMIASSSKLGLGAAANYIHFIITGPAGSYFQAGFNPIPVYVADEYRRAVIGGVGEAKTGGNYAASLYISEEVAKQGYSQVLWLDAVEGKFKDSQMFVPRMMPKRRFMSLDYVSGDYSAGVSYKEVQPQNNIAEGETGTDGYRMLDLDASKSYDLGDGVTFRSSIFIKNLLDETARNHTSFVKNEVPLAGRNVGFKFRITF